MSRDLVRDNVFGHEPIATMQQESPLPSAEVQWSLNVGIEKKSRHRCFVPLFGTRLSSSEH